MPFWYFGPVRFVFDPESCKIFDLIDIRQMIFISSLLFGGHEVTHLMLFIKHMTTSERND